MYSTAPDRLLTGPRNKSEPYTLHPPKRNDTRDPKAYEEVSTEHLFLGWVLLEKVSEPQSANRPSEKFSLRNILARVNIGDGKEANDTGPRTNELPGELASGVFPISAVAEETTEGGDANNVSEDDGVVAVLLGLVGSLFGGLLGLLRLVFGLLLDLLGSVLGLGLELVFALLRFGLDGLRLKVRGNGRDVGAVDIDQGVNLIVGVLNLWRCGCAPVDSRLEMWLLCMAQSSGPGRAGWMLSFRHSTRDLLLRCLLARYDQE